MDNTKASLNMIFGEHFFSILLLLPVVQSALPVILGVRLWRRRAATAVVVLLHHHLSPSIRTTGYARLVVLLIHNRPDLDQNFQKIQINILLLLV